MLFTVRKQLIPDNYAGVRHVAFALETTLNASNEMEQMLIDELL